MQLAERAVGSVLGLALGDALGAPFELRRSSDVPDPLPALELPWRDLPPGSTTDDTAMAMNLVTSLSARGRFDGDDLAARHLAWFRRDPPDVGNLTRRVLRAVDRGDRAAIAARAIWDRQGPEVSAGNGSVMYCAPLGIAYANRPERLHELAPEMSALTHFDERCGTACLAITLTVAALVRGEPAIPSVAYALARAIARPGGEELEFLVEAVGATRPVDGPDAGFCLYAAAVGLQALAAGVAFEPALRRVVSLGGDTDTNAAVAGALVGARDGAGGLPGRWLELLQGREAIAAAAAALVPLAERR